MRRSNNWMVGQKAVSIFCGLLLLTPSALLMAQDPAPATLLTADQLNNLVAPIALYPDQLLAQVLAASTYPIEIVEAQQWMQQNRGLQGGQLIDAAKQQNWDPSVQAMVAFPDVVALLNRDVRWTTDLGNAFLSQQADVMNAVQTMRARAKGNGRLASTPQQTVTENQSTIEIQPANPQVIYVPSYNPAYVWGAPAWGAYPALGYGYGFGFNPAVLIGAIFSGLLSFGGWGWGLNWLAHGLFLNNLFFGHFGFGAGFGGGRTAWAHNPVHRLGVAYPNRMVASRFAGARANNYSARSFNSARGSNLAARSYHEPARGVDGSRYNSPAHSYSSNSRSGQSSRGYSAPASRNASSHYSAPKMPRASSSHMKAPKAPKASHSSGGHGGGGHGSKHK